MIYVGIVIVTKVWPMMQVFLRRLISKQKNITVQVNIDPILHVSRYSLTRHILKI